MQDILRVGIVGCGNISDIYVRNSRMFKDLEVTSCADMAEAPAKRLADKFSLRPMTVDALIAARDIDIVLNLTSPKAHADISLRAIRAGKHVYTEKPLAITLEDGIAIMREADAAGVRVGSAPDTILGAGLQTAKAMIDRGDVGPIITGLAAVMSRGAEHWHPNPAFLYEPGAGPVLDLGPYYMAALTALLGPVASIRATGQISPVERRYGAEGPLKGKLIDVKTYTTVNAVLSFASGANISFIASWDVWNHGVEPIELHGSLGSIRVPDPDTFGGDVAVNGNKRLLNVHDPRDAEELASLRKNWIVTRTDDRLYGGINYPAEKPTMANYRSLGLAEMANAIRESRPHRCSGQFGLHALAVMIGMLDAARSGQTVEVAVRGEAPAPFTPEEGARLLRAQGVA